MFDSRKKPITICYSFQKMPISNSLTLSLPFFQAFLASTVKNIRRTTQSIKKWTEFHQPKRSNTQKTKGAETKHTKKENPNQIWVHLLELWGHGCPASPIKSGCYSRQQRVWRNKTPILFYFILVFVSELVPKGGREMLLNCRHCEGKIGQEEWEEIWGEKIIE